MARACEPFLSSIVDEKNLAQQGGFLELMVKHNLARWVSFLDLQNQVSFVRFSTGCPPFQPSGFLTLLISTFHRRRAIGLHNSLDKKRLFLPDQRFLPPTFRSYQLTDSTRMRAGGEDVKIHGNSCRVQIRELL